jgi:hypothetical protein
MTKFCPSCGNSVGSSDRFCKYCGKSLTSNGAITTGYRLDTEQVCYVSDFPTSGHVHKKRHNHYHYRNDGVVINVNGSHHQDGTGGDAVAAINYAFNVGAIGSTGDVTKLISIGANHNTLGDQKRCQAIYSIIHGFQKGSVRSTGDVFNLIAKVLE